MEESTYMQEESTYLQEESTYDSRRSCINYLGASF